MGLFLNVLKWFPILHEIEKNCPIKRSQ